MAKTGSSILGFLLVLSAEVVSTADFEVLRMPLLADMPLLIQIADRSTSANANFLAEIKVVLLNFINID